MVHDHLTWPQLLQVLAGSEEPGRWLLDLPLVLIESCPECRDNCGELVAMLEAGDVPEWVTCFELALVRSRWRARESWQALKDRSPEMLGQILKRTPATYGMVDLLVEESHQQASMDWDLALLLAEAAVEMARRLPVRAPDDHSLVGPLEEEPLDSPARAEMLALAHAVLGNALRVNNRDREAEGIFQQAYAYLAEAEDSICLVHGAARVHSLRASLLMDTRRLDEALRVLEAASDAAQDDPHTPPTLLAEIAIKQSLVLGLDGQESEALLPIQNLLQQGKEAVLPPRLHFSLRHRLTEQLVYTEQPEPARALLPEVRELCQAGGRGLDALRVRWLEGRILNLEGQYPEALDIFRTLQQEFLEAGALHDAALLALEIAGALLALDRPAETAEHARQAVSLFLPLQLSKEAHGALALLARAAERQTLSHHLVSALMRFARGGSLPGHLLWT